MAGVSFCLDICLDHGMGVCADVLDAEKAAGKSSGLVQVMRSEVSKHSCLLMMLFMRATKSGTSRGCCWV